MYNFLKKIKNLYFNLQLKLNISTPKILTILSKIRREENIILSFKCLPGRHLWDIVKVCN